MYINLLPMEPECNPQFFGTRDEPYVPETVHTLQLTQITVYLESQLPKQTVIFIACQIRESGRTRILD